ncbi:hypothetical protein [Bradyrhizobium sp.]|uniref:hypothetical protein n=1 Tax=Bradyrhizobium sp. TaxID=376 RepID=UPI001E1430AC|nr:hypothetical protein [Bradyrhizobium sp.]MBV8697691.1 hypothetical protein [Bradyrhizobium sp.]MBV8920969.1 hypothetical protein [Bradyrhizobium sp.]MBV9980655.1 hypothetical protein [Bradyrhizobium sp.]
MKSAAVATILLLTMTGAADAGQASKRDAGSCLVEVLRSEELPIGPLFHHTIKATLLVTPPDMPPFERTVYKVITWQEPPPRQGQRMRIDCDPAALSSFSLF